VDDETIRPLAVLLARRATPGDGAGWVCLGPLPDEGRCGLELVDDLARASLGLRRLGFRLRLVGVDRRMGDLLVLAGLHELLCD